MLCACEQVVDVELGSGVPHISNLQALASPSPTIWPQALFDLDFTGDTSATLRFLDTNLCPDIEIRIQLAPTTILPSSNASYYNYLLQNLSLSMESTSFGDGSYKAMVDARMATGNPLVIPSITGQDLRVTPPRRM